MAESRYRPSSTGSGQRSRSEGDSRSRVAGSRTPSAEELRELAEELEEHGRALLARARELQRMAGAAEGPAARSGPRGPRTDRGPSTGRGERPEPGDRAERGGSSAPRRPASRGERSESSGAGKRGGTSRPKRDRDGAPDWAPKAKKRRS